ncbi:unnamed protein product [Bathycoccus prasinos]
MSEMSVGRQKCQKCHIRSDEQIRSDQIRSDSRKKKRSNFVKAEKKAVRESEAETEEAMVEFGPLTRKDTHKAKQRRKRQKRKAKRAERTIGERQMQQLQAIISTTQAISARINARIRNEQIEDLTSRNSPNQKVHFFAEFSNVGASRNMKVASDEVNAPVKYGLRLCDTEKITDQILGAQNKIAATRLRFNPRTKEYFVDAIVKVPKTSEKKEGINIVMGNDPGITPMDTVYIGSTGECFYEQIEGNGGRNLLFKKAEKVRTLEEQLRKMSWSELKAHQIKENRPNPRTRKQWCRSKRKRKKRLEKARVVLQNYRKIFHYKDINAKLAKGDRYVHNKLNSKRILMESKQTYDGPGRKARTNASILAYGEYTERLKMTDRIDVVNFVS